MSGLLPVHTPAWQESIWVQALLSLHAVPSGFTGLLHTPVIGLHAPTAWQASCAAQVTGLLPVHTPAWQVSVWVQALLSLHALPSAFAGLLQTPVAALQIPAAWPPSSGAQTTGDPPA